MSFKVKAQLVLLLLLGIVSTNAHVFAMDIVAAQLVDANTRQPLGYVSVSVLHHPFGTIASERGYFSLNLPVEYDADSVRFSLVGYASRTLTVKYLRQLAGKEPIILKAQAISLREATVQVKGLKKRILGNDIKLNAGILQGFKSNMSGNQLGQRITIKKLSSLELISFGIAVCTYDTVYLRLNILDVQNDFPGSNILTKPIYLRISRSQATAPIYVDLRKYKLWVDNDIIVSLELVRSLGKGKLFFAETLGGGPVYGMEQNPGPSDAKNVRSVFWFPFPATQHAQSDGGPWIKQSGVGMCLAVDVLQMQ